MTILGNRVKLVRKSMGYTQEIIANETGVSLTAYKNYEKGKHPIPSDVLEKLIEVTGCDPGWLLTGKEPVSTEAVDITVNSKESPYISVPMAQVAAGPGRQQLEMSEDNVVLHTKLMNLGGRDIIAARVFGESMEPVFRPGDIVIARREKIDLSNLDLGAYYLVLEDGGLTVKTADPQPPDRLTLLSLNPRFRPLYIQMEEGDPNPIIGKVIGAYKSFV